MLLPFLPEITTKSIHILAIFIMLMIAVFRNDDDDDDNDDKVAKPIYGGLAAKL